MTLSLPSGARSPREFLLFLHLPWFCTISTASQGGHVVCQDRFPAHLDTHTHTHTHAPTATIKCYKLWVSGEPLLVCPPLEHLCPETRTIATPCKQCAQNCRVHMFCMCVWDLIGHDSGMHTCTQLELQIYGLKKMKGSCESKLTVHCSMMASVIWAVLSSSHVYQRPDNSCYSRSHKQK